MNFAARFGRQHGRVRALIVGANDAGETLLRAIRRNPETVLPDRGIYPRQ